MENKPQNSIAHLDTYVMESAPAHVKTRYRSLVQAAQTSNFGELDKDVVVIDTETTGVSFKHDELIQIAAAHMCDGEIVDWFVTFVNPGKPIPEDIEHLTGITNVQVKDAPAPSQALRELVDFVGTSYLVAHNAAFDRHFVTRHQEGRTLRDNIWVDSLDLSRIALPRLKSHRLIDLVHAFGAPVSTHRADDDVAATCYVYRVLLAGVAAMPPALVSQIANMATSEEWPTVTVFKYFANKSPDDTYSVRRARRESLGTFISEKRTDAEMLASDTLRGLSFAADEEIRAEFNTDGAVDHLYTEYEPRDEQVQMACAVNGAFASSKNLVVEAGTGVGKSMAYLIPAIYTAKKNGIGVGVATKTNALLDQLINKELPLLKKEFGDITYTALKGFTHYPCLRKIDRLVKDGPTLHQTRDGSYVHQAPALAGLLSFIDQSEYDDIDTLKIDYRALPRYFFTTTSHDCLRRKCPFFGKSCFVHGARRKAEVSDIVVTNHTMLFCDLVADGGLLPPIRYWVVDEAHGVEDEARRAFSLTLDAAEISRMATRAASVEPSKNVFLRAERRMGSIFEAGAQLAVNLEQTTQPSLKAESSQYEVVRGSTAPTGKDAQVGMESAPLFFGLSGKAKKAGKDFADAASNFNKSLKDLLYFDPNPRKGYDHVEVWLNDDIRKSQKFLSIREIGKVLYDATEKLIKAAQDEVAFLEGIDEAAEAQRDIASLAMDLRDLIHAADVILFSSSEAFVYSAFLSKKKDKAIDHLDVLLLNVGDKVCDTLFANTHSVVFTSATITVDGSFDPFTQALGIGTTPESEADLLELGSSYDFDHQMTIYVASDMPEPRESGYISALEELLIEVHRAQQGSVLSLFTNRKEMEKCHTSVREALHSDNLRVMCQKWGVSVKGLRDEFVADEHLSLFALKSFWEGFDAPGATLKTVVIPKLPFSKPTDPLSCGRAEVDPAAWRHFVLPKAILETKQAAGRLIRSSTDTGNLVLADRRLLTKGYGKKFLNSLPSSNIKILPTHEIAQEIARQ